MRKLMDISRPPFVSLLNELKTEENNENDVFVYLVDEDVETLFEWVLDQYEIDLHHEYDI